MKWLVLLVGCLTLASNAVAQTTFSFAGLAWGDPVQTVDSKLKAAGFSGCAMHEKLFCPVRSSCNCRIEGPTVRQGWAELTNNRLEAVWVVVDDKSETRDALTKRYGRHLPANPGDKPHGKFDLGSDSPMRWQGPAGDSVELDPIGGRLVYKSGDRNRGEASKDQARKALY